MPLTFFAFFSPKNETRYLFTAKVPFLPLVIIFSTAGRKLLALASVVVIFSCSIRDLIKSLISAERKFFVLPKSRPFFKCCIVPMPMLPFLKLPSPDIVCGPFWFTFADGVKTRQIAISGLKLITFIPYTFFLNAEIDRPAPDIDLVFDCKSHLGTSSQRKATSGRGRSDFNGITTSDFQSLALFF